jgi:tRNA/tmRNA/rRNA uracil-C5-methylase (TrmA/RlmC/RlmD family)
MSFVRILYELAAQQGLVLPAETHPEPCAALDYGVELALKRAAFAAFWRAAALPGEPEPVVAAPAPRGYRTTTKRRAVAGPRGFALTFPGLQHAGRGAAASALDLPEHGAVHTFLAARLQRPAAQALAGVLSWTIVRGAAGQLAVILNVRRFDARVVRAAKQLAEALQASTLGVRAAFLYLDPSGSDYYLEAKRPAGTLSFKRLFGPEWLQVEVRALRLRFPVTVFSQVNEAMLPVMAEAVIARLGDLAGRTLLDLYCGYGLFSLVAGGAAAHVVGVDVDGPAVEAARANATHLGAAARTRFVAGRLDAEFVAGRLKPPSKPEIVLLDPPRQGTAPGVVEALAARAPSRVVHICCGTAEIPREVRAWQEAGYALQSVLPLDLFAGTASLETLLSFERGSRAPGKGAL